VSWQQSLERLQELVPGHSFQHQKTERNAVTTAWGVDWDEVLIARDLIQNFFDANRHDVARIRIESSGRTATVAAPTPFNLERLFFLGSEKTESDVGQYGEGFKVAITCLLRDHEVTPLSLSGDLALVVRISEEPVRDTQLYPLVYDFFTVSPPIAGTTLLLSGCTRKLLAALKEGLHHFFYPSNPLIGSGLWSSRDGRYAIYESTTNNGYAFYRNLRRGEVAGIPLVLCIRDEVKKVEKRIGHDRDRNAFGEELLGVYYAAFAQQGLRHSSDGQAIVVRAAKPSWPHGHSLLSTIADTAGYRSMLFDEKTTRSLFGDGYFAHSATHESAEQLRYSLIESEWEKAGRIRLPGYFAKFGVVSAEQYLRSLDEKARQESRKSGSRSPSPAEREGILLLQRVLKFLAPTLSSMLENRSSSYTVGLTDVVLGELRSSRHYQSVDVYLAAVLFTSEFSHAMAVFLHEHSHIFGYDGSRGFTDALTELLETVVQYRNELTPFEEEWGQVRTRVQAERRKKKPRQSELPDSRLQTLSEEQLRDLLARVPPVVLKTLLTKYDHS
jgi:hypothetical protein